jgi:hypothetical protein
MQSLLPALILILALAAAAAPAAQPSSLYPATKPLYMNAPPYQATPIGAYAPTPPPQPTFGGAYPTTPTAPGTPSVGAAPLQAAPADGGPQAAAPSQVQPSAASLQAPVPAQAAGYAQGSSGAGPGSAAAAPSQVQPQAQPQFSSSQSADVGGASDRAVPVALASDPWRKSQQVLNEIGAYERLGSLSPEKAVTLRAEVDGLRGGSGLRRPADGAHLSASTRRSLLNKLKAEDAEVRLDAGQSRP